MTNQPTRHLPAATEDIAALADKAIALVRTRLSASHVLTRAMASSARDAISSVAGGRCRVGWFVIAPPFLPSLGAITVLEKRAFVTYTIRDGP